MATPHSAPQPTTTVHNQPLASAMNMGAISSQFHSAAGPSRSYPAAFPFPGPPQFNLGTGPPPAAGPTSRKDPMPTPQYMPIKTADKVFRKYKARVTKDLIGFVAAKLARNTYFGQAILEKSSLSGTEDLRPLDPKHEEGNQTKISPTEFELIWGKCLDSISRLCTYCRKQNN